MLPKGEYYAEQGEKGMTKIYSRLPSLWAKRTRRFGSSELKLDADIGRQTYREKSTVTVSLSPIGTVRFKGKNSCSGAVLCTADDFAQHFVNDTLTLVASLEVIVEKDDLVFDFIDNVRSMSALENLSDITIISGETRFDCHRVLLAGRSEYFEALFRNEPQKKSIKMDKPPELVKAMLEFINKGLIPSNIGTTAMDLIHMADMYGLNLLTGDCENQLVHDLSPDNALETVIVFDKLEHILKRENRDRVIKFIVKETARIVDNPNWISFVQNYPNLITEIFVAKFSPKFSS